MDCAPFVVKFFIVTNGALMCGLFYGAWLVYCKHRDMNDAVKSLRKSIHRYDRKREELEKHP